MGAGLALFAWFLYLVRPGLASWFDADDLMNIHIYWSRPWSALIKANLAFWSSFYRPGGGLFYKPIYAFWGFHPLPYRIVVLVLLCVNFFLLALVVRQLTGSRWCALMALLLVGINPTFASIYFDTGNIYDILAYLFVWPAFLLYVRCRAAGHLPGWRLSAGLLCLFVLALDCKEISVVLPVAVGLYELFWHPPASWRLAVLWRWVRREGRFAAIGAVLDVVFVAGKRYGPDSLWTKDAYQPHYSGAAYLKSLAHYLQMLIHEPVNITPLGIAAILVAMLIFAAIIRRPSLLWGVAFVLTGVLPLAFIYERGGFAYLVPSVGWAVYVTSLLDWLLEKAAGRRIGLRRAAEALVLVALFGVLAPWQRKWIFMSAHAAHEIQGCFLSYTDQIRALIPDPRRGARIMLLSDADHRDDWDTYFLVFLIYNDPTLTVHRAKVYNDYHAPFIRSSYDYLLDWKDGKFVLVSP